MNPDDSNTVLNRLEAYSSDESRLVSVYVPPEHLVDDAIVFLGQQQEDLDEIGSADRQERIEKTLTRVQDGLAEYDTPPENGMALFCGRFDGEWIEETLETPPQSVESFRYYCEETFRTEPFSELLVGNK